MEDKYKRWVLKNPERRKELNKIYRDRNREQIRAYARKYIKENMTKVKAHKLLNRHIKKGLIVRPELCSKCGKIDAIIGHHEDYSKPLDVIWLCKSCHKYLHIKMKKDHSKLRGNNAAEPDHQ